MLDLYFRSADALLIRRPMSDPAPIMGQVRMAIMATDINPMVMVTNRMVISESGHIFMVDFDMGMAGDGMAGDGMADINN